MKKLLSAPVRLWTAWGNLFKTPTLAEIIANEMDAAVREEEQCRAVIRSHRFQQHMAKAKIDALNAWRKENGA